MNQFFESQKVFEFHPKLLNKNESYQKEIIMKKFIFFVLLLTGLLLMCTSSDQTYKIEKVDGVKHIHNFAPNWGSEPKVLLESVQKIGELETDDDNFILYRPKDVVVDNYGNIYILDGGSFRVQKYTATGEYMATFGRKGQGPGEFGIPTRMDIVENKFIYIHDAGNSRVHRYSTKGEFLDGFSAENFPTQATWYLRHFSTGEFLTNSFAYFEKPDAPKLLNIYSNTGKILKKIGESINLNDLPINAQMNKNLADIDKDDFIYASFMHLNRIDKYSQDGRLIFSTDRPLNYEVIEKPGYKKAGSHRKVDLIPDVVFVARTVSIDSKDRIWIMTANENYQILERSENPDELMPHIFDFHIFNTDGIFLGSVPVPKHGKEFRHRIFGSRLFLFDIWQGECMYEYRIMEKE